jgi:hypothetical protein
MSSQVTPAEIRAILGHADDVLLVEMTRTGATATDVMEACTRLEGVDALGKEARQGANDTVRTVMTLLLVAERPGGERE